MRGRTICFLRNISKNIRKGCVQTLGNRVIVSSSFSTAIDDILTNESLTNAAIVPIQSEYLDTKGEFLDAKARKEQETTEQELMEKISVSLEILRDVDAEEVNLKKAAGILRHYCEFLSSQDTLTLFYKSLEIGYQLVAHKSIKKLVKNDPETVSSNINEILHHLATFGVPKKSSVIINKILHMSEDENKFEAKTYTAIMKLYISSFYISQIRTPAFELLKKVVAERESGNQDLELYKPFILYIKGSWLKVRNLATDVPGTLPNMNDIRDVNRMMVNCKMFSYPENEFEKNAVDLLAIMKKLEEPVETWYYNLYMYQHFVKGKYQHIIETFEDMKNNEDLPDPDANTYHQVMKASLSNHHNDISQNFDFCLKHFQEMKEKNLSPTREHYRTLMEISNMQGDFEKVFFYFYEMNESGILPNAKELSLLMKSQLAANRQNDALEVFNSWRMQNHPKDNNNTFHYVTMYVSAIACYGDLGKTDEAVQMFNELDTLLTEMGMMVKGKVYVILMEGLIKNKKYETVKELCDKFFDVYGHTDSGHDYHNMICRQAIISCLKRKNLDEALTYFENFKKSGNQVGYSLYEPIVRYCADNEEFEILQQIVDFHEETHLRRDHSCYRDMYMKLLVRTLPTNLSYEERMKYFLKLKNIKDNDQPFTSIYGYAIKHSYQCDEIEKGIKILDEFEEKGYTVNQAFVGEAIRILAHGDHEHHLERAIKMFKNVADPDSILIRDMVNVYVHVGDFSSAIELLKSNKNANACCFNVLLVAYSTNKQAEEALALFNYMNEAEILPDHITFCATLDALESSTEIAQDEINRIEKIMMFSNTYYKSVSLDSWYSNYKSFMLKNPYNNYKRYCLSEGLDVEQEYRFRQKTSKRRSSSKD